MKTRCALLPPLACRELETTQTNKLRHLPNDYDENPSFISEARIYKGKREIGGFFAEFIGSLTANATDSFLLKSLRVDGRVAYITLWVSVDIPLGTDTGKAARSCHKPLPRKPHQDHGVVVRPK